MTNAAMILGNATKIYLCIWVWQQDWWTNAFIMQYYPNGLRML